MNDLQRQMSLRNMLKAKVEKGILKTNSEGKIELPNYEQARETGNVGDMLRAKLYGSQYKYEATVESIRDKDINTLRTEKKAIERQLKAVEEEQARELERLESNITANLENELKECTNRLTKDFKISQYLKYAEEQKEILNSKYEDRIKNYNIELRAYSDREEEFIEEHKATIERIKKEEIEKQVREMVLREKAESITEIPTDENIQE